MDKASQLAPNPDIWEGDPHFRDGIAEAQVIAAGMHFIYALKISLAFSSLNIPVPFDAV